MPQPIYERPFQEFDRNDNPRLEPAARRHLVGRDPVPQRPFDASGRFENGRLEAQLEKLLNSACLDAAVKPDPDTGRDRHQTSRCTPTMAADVTSELWSVEGLIEAALTCGI